MRRTLALLPALALFLAACQVEERPAPTTDAATTAEVGPMAEEFRTDMTARLNDIQQDIAEIEERVQDPAYPGDNEDLMYRARELRDEHGDLQRRLGELDTTTHDAFRNDYESFLRDLQGLELRTERALIVAGRTPQEVRETVESRLQRIDDRSGRWATTAQADAMDWRQDYQDRRAELERQLAEMEQAAPGDFPSARQSVEGAYSDLRDRVYRAERDHYDATFAHTATTDGTTAY
jgi:TolA-binding protein